MYKRFNYFHFINGSIPEPIKLCEFVFSSVEINDVKKIFILCAFKVPPNIHHYFQ